MSSLVIAILAFLVVLLELFAPQIVPLVAPGADIATQRLAIDLLRLTAPALIFMSLFAVFQRDALRPARLHAARLRRRRL